MRPTVRDLAKTAGVSLATVDRVLNGRRGVTRDTIERVNRAIAETGFTRNVSAAALARGRALRFLFLLPATDDLFIGMIRDRIAEANVALAAESVQLSVRELDAGDPHAAARQIAEVGAGEVDGVAVMAAETPQVRDALSRLEDRIPHVVALIAGQAAAPTLPFVGIDDRRAGATAARLIGRFSRKTSGTVLVVGESMSLRNEIERRLGFDAVLQASFPGLHALPSLETHRDGARTSRILDRACANVPDLAGIYLMSTDARPALGALDGWRGRERPVIVAHERTPVTERHLRRGTIDALIAQDPGHLVRSAVRRLRAHREDRATIASQEDIRIEVLLPDNL